MMTEANNVVDATDLIPPISRLMVGISLCSKLTEWKVVGLSTKRNIVLAELWHKEDIVERSSHFQYCHDDAQQQQQPLVPILSKK
eukprot:scaffold2944_cov155-Skeletonema_dohrnii-CCMP3373.AAC.45